MVPDQTSAYSSPKRNPSTRRITASSAGSARTASIEISAGAQLAREVASTVAVEPIAAIGVARSRPMRSRVEETIRLEFDHGSRWTTGVAANSSAGISSSATQWCSGGTTSTSSSRQTVRSSSPSSSSA